MLSAAPFLGLLYLITMIISSSKPVLASACTGNTASTRSQWCDYDLTTDYYTVVPETGVTREYYFEIINSTAAPDGIERLVQSINGSIPGPTIEADWGDTVVVHVTNSVTANGTSLHFHGIRQNYTNQNDGVSAITQCPTAPGDSITYTWRATQYGSSWYHSHFSLQAWDGVFGGIIIHGPAAANYDNDLGNLFLTDWTHETADSLYHSAETQGAIKLDTGLINGTNTWDNGGSRFTTTFESGQSYLLRLVNSAIDTHFYFSIDNHSLEVIATDFVPIDPYTTDVLSIGIGQRYDVVITANQSDIASAFWMRAIPDTFCSNNDNAADIQGIVYYSGTEDTTPTTTGYSYAEVDCAGEPLASLSPYLSKTVSAASSTSTDGVAVVSESGLFKWTLNDISFNGSWADPTALQVYDNVSTFDSQMNVMLAPTANEWYYILIETTLGVPHPIHLHGHDFYVVASGTGTYNSSTLSLDNPPRRDTSMLPADGYLMLAFQSDNPGIWLMHCHIGWHTEEGLALQVIEQYDSIKDIYDSTTLVDICDNWADWVNEAGKSQTNDDGI